MWPDCCVWIRADNVRDLYDATYGPTCTEMVILVGIAGALMQLRIGTAKSFAQICCYGIGTGCGSEYQSAGELGWNQWTDPESAEPMATSSGFLVLRITLNQNLRCY